MSLNPQDGIIFLGTFIKYYKISQLIHTQSIANQLALGKACPSNIEATRSF